MHFCGLKIWLAPKEEPEPPKPKPPPGGIYEEDELDQTEPGAIACGNPQRVKLQADNAYMSSLWRDKRVQPQNVFKSTTYNSNWGQGDFTCIHTLNDANGAWWRYNFGTEL